LFVLQDNAPLPGTRLNNGLNNLTSLQYYEQIKPVVDGMLPHIGSYMY